MQPDPATMGQSPPGSPLIAIVTITKDDPVGIRKTLASVQQQDYEDYEHIVVDGGSSPDVAALLTHWRETDVERRLLIDDPPRGIYPAMNAGVAGTTAPVVLVLNGGDELMPGTLPRVAAHYAEHRWSWAYGGLVGRDREGRLQDGYTFVPFSVRLFRAGLKPVPHQATYVARDLYRDLGGYREDLGTAADQEFFLRVSRIVAPGHIPGTLAAVETWGVSNQETFVGRELTWHRLRVASRTAFGGRSVTDLAVTGALLARLVVIRGAAKVRRRLRPGRPPV